MPAPKPNAEAERPRSLFMVNAAKLTLTRSRYATKKHTIRNGTRRAVTFAIVRASNGSMSVRCSAGPRVCFDAGIGAGAEHAGLRIHHDRRIRAERPRSRRLQLVPLCLQRLLDGLGDPRLDGQ